MAGVFDGAHDALNRMRRAHKRRTGCYLTAEMIASLGVSFVAQAWGEEDPRDAATPEAEGDR
jgi:hypothetical protein